MRNLRLFQIRFKEDESTRGLFVCMAFSFESALDMLIDSERVMEDDVVTVVVSEENVETKVEII